jgi:hypothetical protein
MAGALGLEEESLWNMSPRVLVWMYSGKMEMQESQMQAIWEAARLTSVSVMNSQGAKIKNLQKLMLFPWEEKTVHLSKKDIARLKKKYQK